ncbi:MAG: hypothetical protein HUJ68_04930, partial [Clostridia bacterium]|nr:hypothetical protein [Clostridia bacterium]
EIDDSIDNISTAIEEIKKSLNTLDFRFSITKGFLNCGEGSLKTYIAYTDLKKYLKYPYAQVVSGTTVLAGYYFEFKTSTDTPLNVKYDIIGSNGETLSGVDALGQSYSGRVSNGVYREKENKSSYINASGIRITDILTTPENLNHGANVSVRACKIDGDEVYTLWTNYQICFNYQEWIDITQKNNNIQKWVNIANYKYVTGSTDIDNQAVFEIYATTNATDGGFCHSFLSVNGSQNKVTLMLTSNPTISDEPTSETKSYISVTIDSDSNNKQRIWVKSDSSGAYQIKFRPYFLGGLIKLTSYNATAPTFITDKVLINNGKLTYQKGVNPEYKKDTLYLNDIKINGLINNVYTK